MDDKIDGLRPSRRWFLGGAAAGALGTMIPLNPAVAATAAAPGSGLDDRMRSPEAWRTFLGDQDMLWSRLPVDFFEAPFLGNGGLGASMYQDPSGHRLQFTLGDSRVHDHQDVAGPVTNNGQTAEMSVAVWGKSRLRLGYLTLDTVGEVTGVDVRLSLWDAELTGTITTTAGKVGLRAFVHATRDLLVVTTTPDAGEAGLSWTFTPFPAVSPRASHNAPPADLKQNPAPVVTTVDGGGMCVQDLTAGGRTATVWRERTAPGGSRTLVATVAHTHPGTTADKQATKAVEAAVREPAALLSSGHRRWWNGFYPRSFVSIPDARLQSFYWIQLYKMASATRADRPVIGTCADGWRTPAGPPPGGTSTSSWSTG